MDALEEKRQELSARLDQVRRDEARRAEDKRQVDKKADARKEGDARRSQARRTHDQRDRAARAQRDKLDRFVKDRERKVEAQRERQQQERLDRQERLGQERQQEHAEDLRQDQAQEIRQRDLPISKQAQERGREKEQLTGVVEAPERGHTTDMKNVLDPLDDTERETPGGRSGPREMTERELDLERRHTRQSMENARVREQSTQENLKRIREGHPVGQEKLDQERQDAKQRDARKGPEEKPELAQQKGPQQAKEQRQQPPKGKGALMDDKKAAAVLRGKANEEKLDRTKERVAARKQEVQQEDTLRR